MPTLKDFSGGLNLRDSPAELKSNETPNALNWTLDQRGAARLRYGFANVVSLPGISGKAAFVFYSEALNQWLCIRETSGAPNNMRLHTRPGDLSGSWTDRGTVGTNLSMLASFVDWPGTTPMVVLCTAGAVPGSGGGTWTWDGTNLTGVTGSLHGYGLAVWQNRVWRVGYGLNDANGNVARLFASKIGDPTIWTGTDVTTVDLRDKDASRLTGLGIAGGALIVFKARSAYRVTDSATGAFSTIDPMAGSIGPLAVVSLRGRIYTWGADNLYEWDGVGSARKVGDKARPFFATDAALIAGVPALCGGALEDRALFAYPPTAGDDNKRLLEFDPEHGWLMKHQLANVGNADAISSFARKASTLYAAVTNANALYSANVGHTDAGSAYDGVAGRADNNFRTPWLQPEGGKLARLMRAQLEGLTGSSGTLKLRVYTDWDGTVYDEYDISTDLRTGGIVGIDALPSILRSLGHARSFAFEFVATSDSVSVSSLDLDFTALER